MVAMLCLKDEVLGVNMEQRGLECNEDKEIKERS